MRTFPNHIWVDDLTFDDHWSLTGCAIHFNLVGSFVTQFCWVDGKLVNFALWLQFDLCRGVDLFAIDEPMGGLVWLADLAIQGKTLVLSDGDVGQRPHDFGFQSYQMNEIQ